MGPDSTVEFREKWMIRIIVLFPALVLLIGTFLWIRDNPWKVLVHLPPGWINYIALLSIVFIIAPCCIIITFLVACRGIKIRE